MPKETTHPAARVLALVTQKGGTGKSTLATSIAVAATEAGENVLLVDLDKQGTVRDWGETRKAKAPAVAYLPDEKGAQLSEVIAAARASYTIIIIDSPGQDSPVTHSAMTAADLCLVPIRPTKADGLANRTTVEALLRGKKRFGFLLNQCPTIPGSSRADEMAAGLSAIGYLAKPKIGARVDYQDAYAAGQGVTEYQPAGKAADEMRQLWNWITSELAKGKVSA